MRLSGTGDDGVAENPRAGYLDLDGVAGAEGLGPARSAAVDDVAGQERHDSGGVAHDLGDVEDELVGAPVLGLDAVGASADLDRIVVETRRD